MEVVANSLVYDVIYEVYQFGVIIVGISVGVVVMSKKMIIGNEWCYLEYIGNFCIIEFNNMEIVEGLGLLNIVIVDQYFIWCMWMNCLIIVVFDYFG